MKRLGEYARTFVISPEFVVVLVAAGLLAFAPSLLDGFRDLLKVTAEVAKWVALVPVCLLALTFTNVRKILFPEKDSKDLLHGWEDYWRLRIICNVALTYAILFVVIGVAAWLLDPVYDGFGFILTLSAVTGAGITFLTVFGAELRMNEEFASWRAQQPNKLEQVGMRRVD